jgi:hypothetical protein
MIKSSKRKINKQEFRTTMKKKQIYQKPSMEVVEMEQDVSILQSSVQGVSLDNDNIKVTDQDEDYTW